MPKVLIYRGPNKDTFPVSAATITSGWLPGQLGALNTDATSVKLAITDETLFLLADATTELASPPTGSLVTCLYGTGTKVVLDHSAEVAAGTVAAGAGTAAKKSYDYSCESGAINQDLYVNASGKFTTAVTGSVKAKMIQIPAASNNFGLGVILRF